MVRNTGHLLDEYQPEGKKAMEPGTAYMITDVLKDVITRGTGTNARIDGLIQAGKTGTSNYNDADLASIGKSSGVYPDILFVGYTPDLALSVWTGYNDHLTPVTDASSSVATDVYRSVMQYVTRNNETRDWSMPDTLRRVGNELYWADKYQAPIVSTPPSSVTEPSSTEPSSSSSSSEPPVSSSEPPVSSSTPPSESETPPSQPEGGTDPEGTTPSVGGQ